MTVFLFIMHLLWELIKKQKLFSPLKIADLLFKLFELFRCCKIAVKQDIK